MSPLPWSGVSATLAYPSSVTNLMCWSQAHCLQKAHMAEECLSTILTYATEHNRSTDSRMERSVSPDSVNMARGNVLYVSVMCVCSADASRSRSLMQSDLDFCPCCGIGSPDRTTAPWCCRATGNKAKCPSIVVTRPTASQIALCCSSQQHCGLSGSQAVLFWCFSTTLRSVCGTIRTTRIDACTACRCHRGTGIPLIMLLTTAPTAPFCCPVRLGTLTTGAGTYGMLSPEDMAATSFCKKCICAKSLSMRAVCSRRKTVPSRLLCCGGGAAVSV